MSRSFHVTRKSIEKAGKIASCNSNRVFAEEYEQLGDQYSTKRRTKRHVNKQRKSPSVPQVADSIDTLPIEIQDHSKYLHYPVTEQDIRALLKQMPQGLADGLSKITFCLGKQHQSLPEEPFYAEPERDPYLKRISYKVFNDVYRPRGLGTYFVRRREIKIYGYVYDSKIRDRWLCEFYLRLHMLMTFIHELSHHHDLSCRVAKGRWRADDRDKVENYAEQTAHQWMEKYVIPYIEKTYPDEYKRLYQWMKEKIGIVVPLSLLAGDCRSTAKNGNIIIRSLFNTSTAFEEFVQEIQSGRDQVLSCIDFAEGIHRAEEYDCAMKILDIVLSKNSKQVNALYVYGDIMCHLNRPQEAIKFAKKALACENRNMDACEVLCDAYELQEDWRALEKWSIQGMQVAEILYEGLKFERNYIKALIGLGKIEDAQKAFLRAKQKVGKRRLPIFLRRIESELKKKTGKRK